MTDRISRRERSDVMRCVKGKNTSPEKQLQKIVRKLGYRISTHFESLPGKPDIVVAKDRKALFLHGCFWHGHRNCKRAARPTSNVIFWNKKLDSNAARDRRNIRQLRALKWKGMVVWECALRVDAHKVEQKVATFLKS